MGDIWSWERAWEVLPELLRGLVVTIEATVVGMVIASILGLFIALAMRAPTRWVRVPLKFVVDFIRMTPLLVQLVFVYLLSPPWVPGLVIGFIVLGVHYATYMSEVYRAGIEAVPRGQWEAATALNMARGRTWRAVILPQAIRNTLPGLGNYAISMFKETPFLFAISVVEMYTAAQQYGAGTFSYIEALTMVGLLFLAVSYPTSLLVRRMEIRLA
ncbi:amino acid ABC transporter membrane protein 2 (PAAT family) [Isoptericola sp. CG 20/1183]|uniref:Amino acid ABC transporter membrane protein 2 (PAAT family) n=1 Tax=Isoptericola halotolerans TaxID=300560 RepID=A0ABX5EFV5_9MICO|nr:MULTISPECIES: ectoine/hydroxyectoine ABC transporter permease subunit EhuD [Isoptericola]PRZ06340.1 amino acid ABC transporter membrane protein 2 (PAAT family) [Isoptericola halotolerans]PRZ06854.1 amino acid ABC transporter membrane protein 2 (PAAT family) [Isoptericola sp. CG 20/1183]